MRELLMGIDIGTSSCKVAVFTPEGRVLASGNGKYPVYYPKPGWVEQQPDEWWQAVAGSVRKIFADTDIQPEEITGIGVDGQSWSAVAVGRDGRVLCPNPIWMDTRAEGICREVNERIGADRIFDLAGNPFQPMYTTPKVLWYRQERPELYERIDKILQSNSFIVYRLTGEMTQDLSQG